MTRISEISTLKDVLSSPESGLTVVGISGPGGIGKTYLLNEALRELDPRAHGYLSLTVDGSAETTRSSFAHALHMLAPRSLPEPAKPNHDYFTGVRKVVAEHERLLNASVEALGKCGAPPEHKAAAKALIELGKAFNKATPKSKEYLDVAELVPDSETFGPFLDNGWDLARSLQKTDLAFLPGPLRDVFGFGFSDRVQNDLFGIASEHFKRDLLAIVKRYAPEDTLTLRHDSLKGLDKVLIVLDDYEATEPLLGEFVVGHLLKQLQSFPFPVVVIVLCRDELALRHQGWTHHWSGHIKKQIRVHPFTQEEAREFLTAAGVPVTKHAELLEQAGGMPFLIRYLAEEHLNGQAGGVAFLRAFYDRTSRWLNETEKAWLERVVYLDTINFDTLARLFPDADVKRVYEWFEREASLRDPASETYRIRPLIRAKLLRYLEQRSPSNHREMSARAASRPDDAVNAVQ